MTESSSSPAATRRRWMLGLWWLWLPAGVVLIVSAIVSEADLASRGGPFIIGCLLLIWGIAGACAAYLRGHGQ